MSASIKFPALGYFDRTLPVTHMEPISISDPRPYDDLLKRVLKSKEFRTSPRPRQILKIIWDHHFQGTGRKLSTAGIIFKCDERHLSDRTVRKEIFDIRDKLRSYFQRVAEPTLFTIEMNTYALAFAANEGRPVSAEEVLMLFWRPYLFEHRTVLLMAADFLTLTDMQPKQHWNGPPPGMPLRPEHISIPIRGSLTAARGQEYRYLPSGLIRAVTRLSGFFASHGVPFEYDISSTTPDPSGSVIVIGGDPFRWERPTWPQEGDYVTSSEDASERAAHGFQDNLTSISPPRFTCYAKIKRAPVLHTPRVFKVSIEAYHSVALEAAAEFITSKDALGNVLELAGLPKAVEELPDYLAFLLKVTCAVDEQALSLIPGIPRIYLEILNVELLKSHHGPARSPGGNPEVGYALIQAVREKLDREDPEFLEELKYEYDDDPIFDSSDEHEDDGTATQ